MEGNAVDEGPVEVSVVLPCLDEAETVGACIREARLALADAGLLGEVIVADNGSTDGSQEIAQAEGARVVEVRGRGYGSALRGGVVAAAGCIVVIADADSSYDLTSLPSLVSRVRDGADLVVGDRFAGGIDAGAMPWQHRVIGTPALSVLGRVLFSSRVRDFNCGLRAFRREAFLALELRSSGMEFASEMIIKASLMGLCVAEFPVHLRRDGRSHPPHLRSWRDGWRHLSVMLFFSPRWPFLVRYPPTPL